MTGDQSHTHTEKNSVGVGVKLNVIIIVVKKLSQLGMILRTDQIKTSTSWSINLVDVCECVFCVDSVAVVAVVVVVIGGGGQGLY